MKLSKLPTETLEALQKQLQKEKETAAKKFDQRKVVDILFTQAEIESILNSRQRQIQTEHEIAQFVRHELGRC